MGAVIPTLPNYSVFLPVHLRSGKSRAPLNAHTVKQHTSTFDLAHRDITEILFHERNGITGVFHLRRCSRLIPPALHSECAWLQQLLLLCSKAEEDLQWFLWGGYWWHAGLKLFWQVKAFFFCKLVVQTYSDHNNVANTGVGPKFFLDGRLFDDSISSSGLFTFFKAIIKMPASIQT